MTTSDDLVSIGEVSADVKTGRSAKAAATRRRICASAQRLFAEVGYAGATMEAVAADAGVAVQTVYFVFHTKAELLQACFDFAVLGPERLPPTEQQFFADILAAGSGRAALAAFVRGNTEILRRAAAIKEVAESASHEPDAGAVVAHSERLRRAGMAQIVGLLADRFGLRAGLSTDDAVDLLLMLTSSATYLTLQRYGWSEDKYADWLTDTLARQLLAGPG